MHACMFPEARRGTRSLGGTVIVTECLACYIGAGIQTHQLSGLVAKAFNSVLQAPSLLLEIEILACPEERNRRRRVPGAQAVGYLGTGGYLKTRHKGSAVESKHVCNRFADGPSA